MTNQTEQGAVPPHIASTAPDHIWLDIGEQAHLIDPGDTFKTIAGGVTWSGDNATGCGVKYIRADLAVSIPEGCGWQPIDTAPQGSREMFVVKAFDVCNGFTGGRPYTSDPYCVWRNDDGGFSRWPHNFQPTHWAPLPATSHPTPKE